MFSPPRVTAELLRSRSLQRHLLPGFALDYTVLDPDDGTPWDFSKTEKREKARRLRSKLKAYILIGSPECTPFIILQALNATKTKDLEAMRERFGKHVDDDTGTAYYCMRRTLLLWDNGRVPRRWAVGC